MSERTPGGLFLPDPDSRDELLAPPKGGQPGSIDASAPGDRFAVQASSGYFITDIERWCAELHDPYVLVTDRELSEPTPLIAVLEEAAASARPILVAAPAVRGDALVMMIANKLRGVISAAAVNAPVSTLAAIAAATGCDVVHDEVPRTGQLGSAKLVTVVEAELVIVRRPGH
jgi:chaperonin GroEL